MQSPRPGPPASGPALEQDPRAADPREHGRFGKPSCLPFTFTSAHRVSQRQRHLHFSIFSCESSVSLPSAAGITLLSPRGEPGLKTGHLTPCPLGPCVPRAPLGFGGEEKRASLEEVAFEPGPEMGQKLPGGKGRPHLGGWGLWGAGTQRLSTLASRALSVRPPRIFPP